MQKTELVTPFGARATIYHQGAHITSWIPSNALGEQMFVAKQSEFAEGRPIRGGVPICFPQFSGFGSGPKHGFARNVTWQLAAVSDDQTRAEFLLEDSEETRALWPHAFELKFLVELKPNQLVMTLKVKNVGAEAFEFGGALHTYFAVSDFTQVVLSSLEGVSYWDNGTPFTERYTYPSAELQLEGAFDRVFFKAPDALQLQDGERKLVIEKSGFEDAVVWNPGEQGAKGLADMADDEFGGMLCVEAAQVDAPLTLAAGAEWVGVQVLTL